jgi:hypothetical protein
MYAQFVLVYLIVMAITYRAAQSIAILRFVKMKQHCSSYLAEIAALFASSNNKENARHLRALVLLAKAIVRGISYAVLFAPDRACHCLQWPAYQLRQQVLHVAGG